MVNMIKREQQLLPYLKGKNEIEDAGISVNVAENIDEDHFAAIKVDDYYGKTSHGLIPKAVDFIAVVDCECASFAMYILELKNVNSPTLLNITEIQEKFANTINNFLQDQFSSIFENDRFKYKLIKLYLVSDAYHETGKFATHEEYLKFRQRVNKKDTLKVDTSLSSKLYRFRRKILKIEYEIPPNPVIKKV